MAGENDVFSILGKVEVDLAALKASLGAAEAEVRASADRQGKTWKEAATKASEAQQAFFKKPSGGDKGTGAWTDPRMIFGEAAVGGIKAAEGAHKAAEGMQHLHRSIFTTAGGIRGFTHVVNTLVPGMGGMASGLLTVARHLGPIGAIAIVAAVAFAFLTSRMKEHEKLNYEVARSLQTLDYERLSKQAEELNENLAKQADIAKRASQEVTGFMSFLGASLASIQGLYNFVLGKGQVETENKLAALQPIENPAIARILAYCPELACNDWINRYGPASEWSEIADLNRLQL